LFVLYCLALLDVWIARKWKFKTVLVALIASLIPFGTFWLEARILRSGKSQPN